MIIQYNEERNLGTQDFYIKINNNNVKIGNIHLGTVDIQLSSYNTYYVFIINQSRTIYISDNDNSEQQFNNEISNNKKIFSFTKQEILDKFNIRKIEEFEKMISNNFGGMPLQIDTGIINPDFNINEITIKLYENLDNYSIKTTEEVEYKSVQNLNTSNFKTLFPSYALKINDNTYKCTKDGEWLSDNKEIKYSNNIEVEVQKYSQMNFDQPLNREYDNEQLYVMTSVGSIDHEVINLSEGKAKVMLTLPENYTGEVSLSVGRSKNLHLNTYKLNIV